MKLNQKVGLFLALLLALGLFAPAVAAHRPTIAGIQLAAVNWNH